MMNVEPWGDHSRITSELSSPCDIKMDKLFSFPMQLLAVLEIRNQPQPD